METIVTIGREQLEINAGACGNFKHYLGEFSNVAIGLASHEEICSIFALDLPEYVMVGSKMHFFLVSHSHWRVGLLIASDVNWAPNLTT